MVPYFAQGLHMHNNSRSVSLPYSGSLSRSLTWGHSRVSAAMMDGRKPTPMVLIQPLPLAGNSYFAARCCHSNVFLHTRPLGSRSGNAAVLLTRAAAHIPPTLMRSVRRTWKVDGIRVVFAGLLEDCYIEGKEHLEASGSNLSNHCVVGCSARN
jgi:hypothetical protein